MRSWRIVGDFRRLSLYDGMTEHMVRRLTTGKMAPNLPSSGRSSPCEVSMETSPITWLYNVTLRLPHRCPKGASLSDCPVRAGNP